ncbi:hypothetical protein V866_001961 [Kwoniella sp. B9012]
MSGYQGYHDDVPPPPYQRNAPSTSRQDPRSFTSTSNTLDSSASWSRTQKDKIDISLKLKLEDQDKSLNSLGDLQNGITPDVKEYAIDPNGSGPAPPLNIVVFYLGDKFGLIPLLLISLELIKSHSHRVRISTQEIHGDTIMRYKERLYGLKAVDGEGLEDHLEFYDVLAGPKFSIKNWSDDPRQMETTLRSLYRSTYLPCSSTGTPFAADLIISHPDTLAHVHLAELYGIPLHIISDKPISPTISFPHPQTTITQSDTPGNISNYLSYALSENLIWRELSKAINKNFRQVPLALQPLDESTGPAVLDRLKIPVTYIWDEELRKKADDWKGHIDVTGFIYDDDTAYRPSEELSSFLEKSESTIYVNLDLGTIDAALKEGVVSSLAGGLKKMGYAAILTIRGMEITGQLPSDVFVLDDQETASWLLSNNKVSAIIYDGSSYMATLAIKHCTPSIAITLSTGDMYWPERLSHLGASPRPITLSQVTVESLSVALDEALSPERKVIGKQLAESVRSSEGVKEAVASIQRHLPLLNMRCDVAPRYAAAWYHPKYNVLLSSVVAGVLVEQGKLEFNELLLNRPKEYAVTQADSDPMIGGVQAFFLALSESIQSVKYLFGGDPPSREVDISSQQIYSIYNEATPITQSSDGPQRITDFKSGMKEARREMTEGVKDGVKGFVNGPLDPLKRGSLIGGVFGLVGGSIGLVTQPLSGAIRSIESTTRGISSEISNPKPKQLAPTAATSPSDVLRKPRMEISKSHARVVSIQSERDILDRWKECKTSDSVLERRKRREEILSGRGSGSGSVLSRDGIVLEYKRDNPSGSGEQDRERKWWKGKGRA